MSAGRFLRERKADPRAFDPRSFRTITRGGHRLVIGCRLGEWDPRTGKCRVGTRLQAVLHPAHEAARLLRAGRKLTVGRGRTEKRVTPMVARGLGKVAANPSRIGPSVGRYYVIAWGNGYVGSDMRYVQDRWYAMRFYTEDQAEKVRMKLGRGFRIEEVSDIGAAGFPNPLTRFESAQILKRAKRGIAYASEAARKRDKFSAGAHYGSSMTAAGIVQSYGPDAAREAAYAVGRRVRRAVENPLTAAERATLQRDISDEMRRSQRLSREGEPRVAMFHEGKAAGKEDVVARYSGNPAGRDKISGHFTRGKSLRQRWLDGEVSVEVWSERDRLHIGIRDEAPGAGGEYIASWWDDDARRMIEDGFFKSGPRLKESVIEYAQSVGLPAYAKRTRKNPLLQTVLLANPRKVKKIRFKDLSVGEMFVFASEYEWWSGGMAKGPWIKNGHVTYEAAEDVGRPITERRYGGGTIRVGSINVEVVRVAAKHIGSNPRVRCNPACANPRAKSTNTFELTHATGKIERFRVPNHLVSPTARYLLKYRPHSLLKIDGVQFDSYQSVMDVFGGTVDVHLPNPRRNVHCNPACANPRHGHNPLTRPETAQVLHMARTDIATARGIRRLAPGLTPTQQMKHRTFLLGRAQGRARTAAMHGTGMQQLSGRISQRAATTSGFSTNPATRSIPWRVGQRIPVAQARAWVVSTGDKTLLRQFDQAQALQAKANKPSTHVIWQTLPIGSQNKIDSVSAMVHYGDSPETYYTAPKGSKKGRALYRHKWESGKKSVPLLVAPGGRAIIMPLRKGQTIDDWMRG